MFLRLSIPPGNDAQQNLIDQHKRSVIEEPAYGTQLQDFAIQGHRSEGKMQVAYKEIPVTLADGTEVSLRQPTYSVKNLGYGPMHPDVMLSPRVAPQMIGLGLLEAIPEQAILANADAGDVNQDGISGKPNRVWSLEHEQVMLGRFGWKAGAPSVNEQSQGAFAGDIGISVPLHPSPAGECSEKQKKCRQAPDGNSVQYGNLEASAEVIDLVVFYSRNLAVPKRRDFDAPEVLAGKRLFYEIGCVQCHQAKFVTPEDPNNPEQSGQLIWPYTNLLLHDMGEGLADGRPEGAANG